MKVLVLLVTVLSLTLFGKSPPADAGALKALSQLKENQKPVSCEEGIAGSCQNPIAVYADDLLPDNQIIVLGIDGRMKSYNLLTGKKYWESTLEMTLIESLDSEAELLPEYYIPTLNGDILAFSNTSLWNTTAKV